MFNRLKSALYSAVGVEEDSPTFAENDIGQQNGAVAQDGPFSRSSRDKRLSYCRPAFLQLSSADEVSVTADHAMRPIICPRSFLPWDAGYAEAVNAGKSRHNEDQGCVHVGYLSRSLACKPSPPPSRSFSAKPGQDQSECNGTDKGEPTTSHSSPSGSPHFFRSLPEDQLFVDEGSGKIGVSVPYYYFAVFDGHAGWGAAVYASQHLHHILHTNLCKVVEFIIPDLLKKDIPAWQQPVDTASVVTGALEQSFYFMDKKIEEDRQRVGVGGGCTACVALFIMGKLYVANAGDSRATACLHGKPHSMSYDFTPESENYRIRKHGAQHPDLLRGIYSPIEFVRRPLRRELGASVLCRQPYMARGWVYKKITEEDLKVPLVSGSGKRSRVMATIGVTRGFGDHDLKGQLTNVHIKPFLSCEPEVRILDLELEDLSDQDVLILATDGLWDIMTNERAVSTLLQSMERSLHHFPSSDPSRHKYRYMSAAQDLVMGARGKLTERNWRTSDNKHATIDDISVFVVPLKSYQEEHQKWKNWFEARASLMVGTGGAQLTGTQGTSVTNGTQESAQNGEPSASQSIINSQPKASSDELVEKEPKITNLHNVEQISLVDDNNRSSESNYQLDYDPAVIHTLTDSLGSVTLTDAAACAPVPGPSLVSNADTSFNLLSSQNCVNVAVTGTAPEPNGGENSMVDVSLTASTPEPSLSCGDNPKLGLVSIDSVGANTVLDQSYTAAADNSFIPVLATQSLDPGEGHPASTPDPCMVVPDGVASVDIALPIPKDSDLRPAFDDGISVPDLVCDDNCQDNSELSCL
ncbi:hypothetical protein HAZT_HAZT000940 [Hyalella azteca]|uniref:PPM-type phosphatase domain-containing protein n=1 Tax=Hyalella azteca TaxID=294128 RepID=A0A6A0H0B6_HYAAZ|nr:hypothetical protein HAZT_HAZT000940 [Hyalella azteca]